MHQFLKHLNLFCFLILTVQLNIIEGQENPFINGKLIDSKDKNPISFATVLIKNKAKGAISNIDGGFKIPYELYKRDTLVISSMGYSSKEIPLSSLLKNKINLIVLEEQAIILDEVLLVGNKNRNHGGKGRKRKMNAEEIVLLAIKKIPKNYPFNAYSYIGYYRDYQIRESKYLNLNEALMEVFDNGFGISDLKETQTRIYQYKKNLNFPTDTIASRPYDYQTRNKVISNGLIDNRGGNEYTILRIHDAIRNYSKNSYDYVNRLDLNFVKNHTLDLLPDTSIDNTPLYSINIYRYKGNIKVLGKIFISKGDFKIYKIQYAVYNMRKSLEFQNKTPIHLNASKPKEKNLGKLLYEILVEYRSYMGKMYPNYISFNNSFEILQPPLFYPIDAIIDYDKSSKLSITSIEVTFNNTPLIKDLRKKRNYELYFKDEKLRIKNIQFMDKKVILNLHKKMIFDYDDEVTSEQLIDEDITIKIKNIKDIYGNFINTPKYISYNQYREFFVQELKTNSKKPIDTLYMLKNKSIFKNQPIAPFMNLSDYWLNTPLKND